MVRLDICQRIYYQEIKCSQDLSEEEAHWYYDALLPLADWNEVRRDLNVRFDRLIEWSRNAYAVEQSRQLDELNDQYSASCDRIKKFTLISIVFGGREAITQLTQDVMMRFEFQGINANRVQQLLAECQRLEGLRELGLQLLERKAEDGNWPTSIDDLKSSASFTRIVVTSQ